MGRRVPLRISVVGVLNASGNLTLSIGPLSAREVWYPENVSVRALTSVAVVNEAECRVYVGPSATESNFRDATVSGSSGDSTGHVSGDKLVCGDKIWCVWIGGDAGANAYAVVTGWREV